MESQNHVLAEMDSANVGIKRRSRTAFTMALSTTATSTALTTKRRKINNAGLEKKMFSTDGRKSSDTVIYPVPVVEESCSSPTSDVEFPVSRCSSNGSIVEERMKLLDLEVESAQIETSTCNCGEKTERREMRHGENSHEAEINSRRSDSTVQSMPTDLELEEFFNTAEKDIQKRFQDRYNYDVVKDVPLEGRYEWIRL